jgi:hypothetical protein
MTIRTTIIGALALASAAAIAVQPVEARDGRNAALAAGGIGGLALGAAAAASQPQYYDAGPGPDCYVESRRVWDDRYGTYRVRRIRVCE